MLFKAVEGGVTDFVAVLLQLGQEFIDEHHLPGGLCQHGGEVLVGVLPLEIPHYLLLCA